MKNQNSQKYVATYEPQFTIGDIDESQYDDKELLIKVRRNFKKIVSLVENYDELNDRKKLKALSMFQCFILGYEDLVKLVNLKYNTSFTNVKTISTDAIMTFPREPEYGINIVLDCATVDGLTFDDRRYSYNEIVSLINQGKIYPLFARKLDLCGQFSVNKFNKEETDTQKYYDEEENGDRVSRIENTVLKGKRIKCFVPDELKLGRESGSGEFYIDEDYIDEENSKLFMQLFGPYLTKEEVLKRVKTYVLYLEDILYANIYYEKATKQRELIRKYYEENFTK